MVVDNKGVELPVNQQVTPPVEPTLSTTTPKPEEVLSERTKEQVSKLQESNKRLFEANQLLQQELTRKIKTEQVFNPIQQAVNQTKVETKPEIEQFVEIDSDGNKFINEVKLQAALETATSRATKAEESVKQYIDTHQRREDEQQISEAYSAYVELNPSSDKFDADLNRQVRSILLDSMMYPQDYGGRSLSFKGAADFAKKQTPAQAQATQERVEQTKQPSQTQAAAGAQEQGSLEATGSSGNITPEQAVEQNRELENLRSRTRAGDMWAVARRLINTPHVGAPTSSGEGVA